MHRALVTELSQLAVEIIVDGFVSASDCYNYGDVFTTHLRTPQEVRRTGGGDRGNMAMVSQDVGSTGGHFIEPI